MSDLQEETHEVSLLDVLIEPASAAGWRQLFTQHGGHEGVLNTDQDSRKKKSVDNKIFF